MDNCDVGLVNSSLVEDESEETGNSVGKVISVVCIYLIVVVLTILGNLLVILAYKSERNIRRSVGNIFIVNLAVVGLIVGSCFLTINCIWLITDEWIFGEYPCKVWLVVDYTTSYMLVVSMIYISLDRLLQIKLGMSYYKFQTPFRAKAMIGLAWMVMLLYYSVVIFGWSYFTSKSVIDYSVTCEMETMCSQRYNLAMVFVEFLFPFMVLLVLNIRVFWEIRLRAKGLVVSQSFTDNGTVETSISHQTNTSQAIYIENARDAKPDHKSKIWKYVPLKKIGESKKLKERCSENDAENKQKTNTCIKDSKQDPETDKSIKRAQNRLTARHKREVRHCIKAGVTLACLVGVFVVCWLPITLLSAFFSSNKISELWWEVANNLLWCNATLNPILYALTNVHFRNAFKKFTPIRKFSNRNV